VAAADGAAVEDSAAAVALVLPSVLLLAMCRALSSAARP